MQPSMRMHVAARVPPPTHTHTILPRAGALGTKILLPTLAWIGAAAAVGLYVKRQLHQRSASFDHIFAQQNTPEVEAARKRDLQIETYGDPRNSLLNVLGWTK